MRKIFKNKGGFWEGTCEYPECDERVVSPISTRKYCREHSIAKNRCPTKFYGGLNG